MFLADAAGAPLESELPPPPPPPNPTMLLHSRTGPRHRRSPDIDGAQTQTEPRHRWSPDTDGAQAQTEPGHRRSRGTDGTRAQTEPGYRRSPDTDGRQKALLPVSADQVTRNGLPKDHVSVETDSEGKIKCSK